MARPAGQIVQRGPRLWLVRIFLGRDPSTGRRKYHNKSVRGTKKDAQQYLTAALRERDLGSFARPSSEPLGTYLDRWLETAAKPKLKARTYRDYETLLMRYVRPSLEGRPLAKVTPLDVQAVYGKIIEKGLSARTVRYTHAVLRSALQQAVKMATARLQSGGLGLTAQAIEKGDPGSVDRVDAGVSAGRRQGPHRRVVRVGGDGRPASE